MSEEKNEIKEIIKEEDTQPSVTQKKTTPKQDKKFNQEAIEKLYRSDLKNKERLQKMRNEKESELKQICTFKPAINSNYKLTDWETNSEKKNSTIQKDKPSEVLERMNYYIEKGKQKLSEKIDKNSFFEESYTFTPNINREIPEFQEKYIKGTKTYIERQMKSQKLKKEIDDKLNPNYSERYEKLFKKKERKVLGEKKISNKQYQNALYILHNELLSK